MNHSSSTRQPPSASADPRGAPSPAAIPGAAAPADRPWHLSYQVGGASWTRHGVPSLFNEFVALVRATDSGIHVDLGCGNGVKTVAFAEAGLLVVGMDLSIRALTEALERRPGASVQYACARAEALPFLNASIGSASDILMSTHLDGDAWEQYTAELARMLRPGAYVLLVLFSAADEDFHGHPVSKRYIFQHQPGNLAMERFEHYAGMINVHFDLSDIQAAFGPRFEIVRAVQVRHPVYERRYLWNVVVRKPLSEGSGALA